MLHLKKIKFYCFLIKIEKGKKMSYVYPYRSRAYYSPSRSYVQTPYWSSPYKTYTTPVSPSSWVERIPVE